MKAQRLHEAYARRREADFARIEKSAAVNKYYDHWTKVTSRFEAWTDPDYYQQADEALRKEKDKKVKETRLEERRKKLKQLFDEENAKYGRELEAAKRPKSRKLPNDLLEKLGRDQEYLKEERRRLELESKLYGKWRHGIEDEKILFDSKTDNETLAKLSWLDKQIENRMQREQDLKETEERQLRLLEETRKREENLKEQTKIRETQIKELRSIQEFHMAELKSRESQSNELHEKEVRLRRDIGKIESELNDFLARKSSDDHSRQNRNQQHHNVNRIKMFIRQRSEQARDQLRTDIALLDRILMCRHNDEIEGLRNYIETVHKTEVEKQATIESMYESEAKNNLVKWEEIWEGQRNHREGRIVYLLKKVKDDASAELSENLEQQKQLLQIRETHLSSIDNSNEKLKKIIEEQEKLSAETCRVIAATTATASRMAGAGDCEAATVAVESKEKDVLSVSNLSISDETATSPRRPKFGRKKVAWL